MPVELQTILDEIKASRAGTLSLKSSLVAEIKLIHETLKIIPQLRTKVQKLEHENAQMRIELSQLNLQANISDQRARDSNLILYGIPGAAREARQRTGETVAKVFSKTGITQRPVMAHRIGSRENSPVLVQLFSRPDAQDAFRKLRQTQDTSLKTLSLGDAGEVEVRYYLSSFLGNLLRAATLVKKEAGWAPDP